MPQQRMDEHLARGVYEYYDDEWIRRCIEAEQALVRQVQPSLLIADFRFKQLGMELQGQAVLKAMAA